MWQAGVLITASEMNDFMLIDRVYGPTGTVG